jgi:protein CpxP
MKRLAKIAIMSSALVMGVGTLAACGHHYKTPEERAEYMVEKVADKLDLNDMQKEKLAAVKSEMMKLRKQFKGDQDNTPKQVLAIVSQPTLDRDALLNMINARTQAVSNNAPQIVAALGDFYDSLNPEQQAEVRELIEKGMKHHHWYHRMGPFQ